MTLEGYRWAEPRGYREATMGGVLLAVIAGLNFAGSLSVSRLRVEFLDNPLAVDEAHPRFSWLVGSKQQGARPSAYRILVAASEADLAKNRGTLWDSGKQKWGGEYLIEYRGSKLSSRQRAFWKAQAWDQMDIPSEWSKPAAFAMGLLEKNDWTAKWITDPTPAPQTVPGHNGFHSALARSSVTEKWVAIDLGSSQEIDAVTLYPAAPHNWRERIEGFMFPVRFRIEASNDAEFANAKTVVDETGGDFANPKSEPVRLEFPKTSARFVRLVVTKLALRDGDNYAFTLAEMQVLAGRANLAYGAKVSALDWVDGSDWSLQNLTNGDLISHPPGETKALPATMFRREFAARNKPKRAMLYVSARGVYVASINGQRVGTQELAPEWTDYFTRIQYQAYDVTTLVREGGNAIGAVVGDGWYAGRLGMSQGLHPQRLVRGIYGRKTEFIAQLEIEYANGAKETIAADDAWRCMSDGPIRSSDTLDGEVFDARKRIRNWDTYGFGGNDWKAVNVNPITVPLIAQANEPIQVSHTVKPISLSEPKPGVFVYDLGQNLPGVICMKLKAKAGAEIVFHHTEMLSDDGTAYTANLRGAPQVDRYIASGEDGLETFQPIFTYHGFRYVQVTGLESKPAKDDLVAVVFHSNPEMMGTFNCSDPMLNRLWENILWTQRANMMSVPTDCPQRDERLGWMGDIMVFGETATLSMEMSGFYKKWIRDVRDAQADDGRYPDFAPHPYGKNDRFNGVPGWGDAGVTVPWVQYETYGDARVIGEHFESAKRWVDWIHSKNPDFIWRNARHNDYGDWLNGDTLRVEGFPERGSECPKDVFGTLVFVHSLDLVAKMAETLKDVSNAKRYSEMVRIAREKFRIEFTDADGRIKGDTQAGYALAIGWNVLPEGTRKRAVEHLVEAVGRCGGRMSTGFHSTLYLLKSLQENGHQDLAMSLLLSKRFPSWGFMIENGATSMWERWDGYVKGRGFQDPGMNSFNHWAFGAVGEFMVNRVVGIAREQGTIGWQKLLIAPEIVHSPVTWATGSFRAPSGDMKVSWKKDRQNCVMEISIPPCATATVVLQTTGANGIKEGGQPLTKALGVTVAKSSPGNVTLKLGSGSFSFSFQLAK